MITFTWSPAASYTTVVFFPSPGVSFDFASFNFHVPIFGSSAAKHAAPAKKQSATVNPIVFVFMPQTSTDFQVRSMFLLDSHRENAFESAATNFGRSTTTDSSRNWFGGKILKISPSGKLL